MSETRSTFDAHIEQLTAAFTTLEEERDHLTNLCREAEDRLALLRSGQDALVEFVRDVQRGVRSVFELYQYVEEIR